MDPEKLWSEIIALVKEGLSRTECEMWIDTIKLISFTDSLIKLEVNSEFSRNLIIRHYDERIREKTVEVMGFSVETMYAIANDTKAEEQEDIKNSRSAAFEYSFSNFVVGESNRLAYNAALNVAQNPGKNYNPMLIWGRSGIGKTHLARAIENKILLDDPNKNVVYITAENFLSETVEAIRLSTMAAFREKYRRDVDVLIVDDIQILQEKTQTMEEFFNTFNDLRSNGKQIILTMDRPPRELDKLDDRLLTRFEQGLTVDISKPQYEMRLAILHKKAELFGVKLTDDQLGKLASKLDSNVRQLEGALNYIKASTEVNGLAITNTILENAIQNVSSSSVSRGEQISILLSTVAEYFGVAVDAMQSSVRTKEIKNARQVAMYLLRTRMELTQQDIGDIFGKDHSTVISSVKNITTQIRDDHAFKEKIDALLRNFDENLENNF